MSKRQILILLGLWVGIFIFLGLPSGWDKILAIATGLIIIVVSYSLKSEVEPINQADMPYSEHKIDSDPSSTSPSNTPTN